MREKNFTYRTDSEDPILKISPGDLYSFLEQLPVPAALLDAVHSETGEILDFIFTYTNSAAAVALNISATNSVGDSISKYFHGTNQEAFVSRLKDVVLSGVSLIGEEHSSAGFPLPNAVRIGDKVLMHWKVDNNRYVPASKIKELQNSNKELEQFAYIASHDLQEPIRMVISFTQLLQRRYADKLDKDANEYIYYAVDGAQRMKALIDKLLEYSRLSTEKKIWKRVSVSSIIANIIDDFDTILKETGIKIQYGEMPVVISDESLLTRVFSNLISNSIKYRKSDNPEIHISAEENDQEWIFSINDNGIGIQEEHFEKIFLMFQRLHGKTKYPGMGMGLAICKRIIDALGGRIWLESASDTGTTFYFSISKKEI